MAVQKKVMLVMSDEVGFRVQVPEGFVVVQVFDVDGVFAVVAPSEWAAMAAAKSLGSADAMVSSGCVCEFCGLVGGH